MSQIGKQIRMRRLILEESNSCVICALDHGMTSPKFLNGLNDTKSRAREAITGGANVLMMSRGFAKRCAVEFRRSTSLALMLSASAAGRPDGAVITQIGTVAEALRLGADAVVVYTALAGNNEDWMISYLSKVGEACEREGIPLIAEAEWPNAYQTLDHFSTDLGTEYLKRNARLCVELGADIIKVNWSGNAKSFGEIVQACDAPVVIAGGTMIPDEELLYRFEKVRDVGAIGCSVGRNIFQHENPEAITRAISRIFHEKWSAKETISELESTMIGMQQERAHEGKRAFSKA
jgi:fructose-bisphosphate aldolase/2-amino-3,7-dideoxy-D-threo-hept-6-ulosonate synthase